MQQQQRRGAAAASRAHAEAAAAAVTVVVDAADGDAATMTTTSTMSSVGGVDAPRTRGAVVGGEDDNDEDDSCAAAAAAAATALADDAVDGVTDAALQTLMEVDRLMEQGIAAADVSKLKAAGIFTVPGVQMQCKRELAAIKGLSEAKVDKIIEATRKLLEVGFITGTRCLQQRSAVVHITTGSIALDQLLGGGVESRGITEAFGEFRTGKTQIAHTLCVTCQLPTRMGGGNGRAVYVDTEGTFRPERIKPIAQRFGLDAAAVLDNILVARAYTHEHQAHLLSMVAAKMAEEPFALLVVDSVTALFRVDFSGRGELAERQQKLARMLSQLIKLAEEFNVAVYVTNHVVADPGGASMFVADPKKPVGGHVMAHASTTRLSLRKGRGEQRVCKIFDSPSLPEVECAYSITEQGIADVNE